MSRRVSRRRRRRGGTPPALKWAAALAAVLVAAVLFATLGWANTKKDCCEPEAETTATIVVTGGSTNATDLLVTGRPAADLKAVAEQDGLVEQIEVDGDGRTARLRVDMTPRQTNGTELKVPARRIQAANAHLDSMQTEYNAFDTTTPGRSVLSGLQAVEKGGTGPVIVLSALPDTNDPLDFRALAFDVAPKAVVAKIKTAGDLPHHLAGREVVFVVTPATGQQRAFRQPQADYIRKVYTALVEVAGGTATFVSGAGGQPQGTGGEVPIIKVPKATDTIVNPVTGDTTTCTLPAPMLFAPDQAILLDRSEARRALRTCLTGTDPSTRITIEGHTAKTGAGGDPKVAKKLSTDRARVVAELLRNLGVTDHQITRVKGWGATKPIVQPVSDPVNRAVVVSMTTIRTKGTSR